MVEYDSEIGGGAAARFFAVSSAVPMDRQHRIILIPAYRPGEELLVLVNQLAERGVSAVIVVDDGSGPGYAAIFESCRLIPQVHLVRHPTNLGKGAALKSGIEFALSAFPDCTGVVTADADGQHLVDDILRVAARLAERPDSLILGVRGFEGEVPFRSRAGNRITRTAVRLFLGVELTDTQTGLRAIPRTLFTHLAATGSNGYEFELDMLSIAKHHGCPVVEEPIRTVYLEKNKSSHFNPLRDSMRIYFVLLRFGLLSLLTSLVDNVVFLLAYRWLGVVAYAQIMGRVVAVAFNYSAARKAVFLSHERHKVVLPKYLLLVAGYGVVSYGLIQVLLSVAPVTVIQAKIAAETLLFAASFVMQRDFVFTRRGKPAGATDWTGYYSSTPFTAKLTRKYTSGVLLSALKSYAGFGASDSKTLVELGGANSCFLNAILKDLRPGVYHVVDTNEYGLSLLEQRIGRGQNVVVHQGNVLDLALDVQADAVFSIGLVEHFDPPGTRKAILAHFDLLRSGGYAVVSFPTPTALYRVVRFFAEQLGLWKFPDERPLLRGEVLDSVREFGEVVFEKTLWPLVFTQHLMVFRKLDTR